jgi:hypothetical protein
MLCETHVTRIRFWSPNSFHSASIKQCTTKAVHTRAPVATASLRGDLATLKWSNIQAHRNWNRAEDLAKQRRGFGDSGICMQLLGATGTAKGTATLFIVPCLTPDVTSSFRCVDQDASLRDRSKGTVTSLIAPDLNL